jgi:hypothetical protein
LTVIWPKPCGEFLAAFSLANDGPIWNGTNVRQIVRFLHSVPNPIGGLVSRFPIVQHPDKVNKKFNPEGH